MSLISSNQVKFLTEKNTQILLWCSILEKQKSFGFGMTWGWVNNDVSLFPAIHTCTWCDLQTLITVDILFRPKTKNPNFGRSKPHKNSIYFLQLLLLDLIRPFNHSQWDYLTKPYVTGRLHSITKLLSSTGLLPSIKQETTCTVIQRKWCLPHSPPPTNQYMPLLSISWHCLFSSSPSLQSTEKRKKK